MGVAKLLGEGSEGRLRPPVGPGKSPGWGARGGKAPRKLLGFKHLINKFPKKSKINILFIHVVFLLLNVDSFLFVKGGAHAPVTPPWLRP